MATRRVEIASEGSPWTRAEVEALVEDYVAMLESELAGERYSKAEHNRALQRVLAARGRPSIEFKHANVSAVMIELGYRYIDGYKPRWNVQGLLREVVEHTLSARRDLAELAADVAERVVEPTVTARPELTLVKVPKWEAPAAQVAERAQRRRETPTRVNYSLREERNRSLGLAGEKAVLEFEHLRLWSAGHRKLADRIEHVSVTKGDGLGYDVHSFSENGADRLIEVKTTRGGEFMPFFVSKREVEVSAEQGETFHLYRVFDFDRRRRLFTLPGSLQASCALEPELYRGRAR